MALLLVDHFIEPEGSYTVYWDTGSNSGTVDFMGSGTQRNYIAIPNDGRGINEGDLIGSPQCYNGDLYSFYATSASPFANCTITPGAAQCVPAPGCDLEIDGVTITNEQSTGANDGQAQVNASSAFPIQYSLDGSIFQPGNTFTGLAPGNYTAYVKDSNGCDGQISFVISAYVNPVQSYSDDLPVITKGGNISKWSAAFNPIVIKFQRKDYVVSGVTQYNANQIAVQLTGSLVYDQFHDAIVNGLSLKTDKYDFIGLADSYEPTNGFLITTAYLGDDTTGYLNISQQKPSYQIEIEITNGDDPVHPIVLNATFAGTTKGFVRADLSAYLQTFLSGKETFGYNVANYRDYNLAGSYTIRYREIWTNGTGDWHSGPFPLYYTLAAMQLGDQYGGNMANYVPFLETTESKAKFLTGFDNPTFFNGLPFDISFIYSEDIINEQLTAEIIPNCGATSESLLLNADASYLLNADSSRFVIQRIYNADIEGYPVIAQLGVNRLLIPNVFDCCADKLKLNLYYMSGVDKVYVMEDLFIKLNCPCGDPFIYLKWVNKLGAWDYWRFGYNQEAGGSSANSVQVSRYVQDWENDQTIQDFISRKSNRKLTLVAGGIDTNEIQSLQWMQNSIKVQMMVSQSPLKWQTVIIADADFNPYNTRKSGGNFKVVIQLPSSNIQNL